MRLFKQEECINDKSPASFCLTFCSTCFIEWFMHEKGGLEVVRVIRIEFLFLYCIRYYWHILGICRDKMINNYVWWNQCLWNGTGNRCNGWIVVRGSAGRTSRVMDRVVWIRSESFYSSSARRSGHDTLCLFASLLRSRRVVNRAVYVTSD